MTDSEPLLLRSGHSNVVRHEINTQIHRSPVYRGCVLLRIIKVEEGIKGAVLDSMIKESL